MRCTRLCKLSHAEAESSARWLKHWLLLRLSQAEAERRATCTRLRHWFRWSTRGLQAAAERLRLWND